MNKIYKRPNKIIELQKNYIFNNIKIPKGSKFKILSESENGYKLRYLGILPRLNDYYDNIYYLAKHWFEFKFEIDKWYTNDRSIWCVTKIYGNKFTSFGFYQGFWGDDRLTHWSLKEKTRPATDKEVEESLINEAKKRGFKKNERYDATNVGYPRQKSNTITSNNFRYTDNELLIDEWVIFSDGKWAEIVKEKPIIKSTKVIPSNNKSLTIKQIYDKLKNSGYDKEDISDILNILENE